MLARFEHHHSSAWSTTMQHTRFFVWVVLAGLLTLVVPARAAPLNSRAPFTRVSGDGEGSRYAAAMTADGRLHVAWLGQPSASGVPVRYTSMTGLQPEPARTVTDLIGVHNERRPLVMAASPDAVYLAYNRDGGNVCYQRRGTDTWSAPACVQSPSTLNEMAEIDIAVLANGTVALAWPHQGLGVALARPDGTWQVLADPAGSDPGSRSQPRLVASGNDLVVLWVQRRADGPGNSVRTELMGRVWRNGAWSETVSVSGFEPGQNQWHVQDPDIVSDRAGQLHVAYVLFAPEGQYQGAINQVVYRRGSLADLSQPERFGRFAAAPALAVRDGLVDLAWSTGVGNTIGQFPLTNQEIVWSRRTQTWSTPINVSFTAGAAQEPAMFITPGGQSLVVWQDWLDGPAIFAKHDNGTPAWSTPTLVDQGALNAYVRRADRPVETGAVARSWLWGPRKWAEVSEAYADAAGGERPVFYYDKARIEVGDPNRRPDHPAYFTNGLLVTELASGRLQYGDQMFIGSEPAAVSVVGDLGSSVAPTYSSFRSLVYIPEIGQHNQAPDRTGERLNQCINRAGNVSTCTPATPTTYARFVPESGHNIAAPFWTFLNQTGPIEENGVPRVGEVFPWVTTMGYPIAEPYWTRAVVGGIERDVLVQLFQRRVLSYTPGNPQGFEVEMGNVGQHYYAWRYGQTPWAR
jgi:hypothetical protein